MSGRAAVIVAGGLLVLACLGVVVAFLGQRSPGDPAARLGGYFDALNDKKRAEALTYFRADETGARDFVETQMRAAPYEALTFVTEMPFGNDVAQVTVKGFAAGQPFTARYDLSVQDGRRWMIFLGTQEGVSEKPVSEASPEQAP